MNRKQSSAIAAAAAIAAFASTACAGFSIGAFGGKMDTELLGKGTIYGAQIEAGVEPISFILRGSYADDFDELDFSRKEFADIRSLAHLSGIDLSKVRLDDFCIVPIEVGMLLRLPEGILPLVGLYGGGGVGYYYVPAIDMVANNRRIDETDPIDDLVGFWLCAGAELDLSPLHIFAEAKYVDACDDVDVGWGGHTIKHEIDLTGWTYMIGARIGW